MSNQNKTYQRTSNSSWRNQDQARSSRPSQQQWNNIRWTMEPAVQQNQMVLYDGQPQQNQMMLYDGQPQQNQSF